jgi:large subunit ribosomal protein L23
MNRKVIKSGNKLSLERAYDIIKSPVVTEKATQISQYRQFVFRTADDVNKIEIKEAIEKIFKVKVKSVNTLNRPGKQKRFRGYLGKRSGFKKAIVTLVAGQSIDVGAGI